MHFLSQIVDGQAYIPYYTTTALSENLDQCKVITKLDTKKVSK